MTLERNLNRHRRKPPVEERGLDCHGSVMHACGGNHEAAVAVLKLLDKAIEEKRLSIPREACMDIITPLEDGDGERDGRDRGSHRLLKAITVLLRLKGYDNRDNMTPIEDIDLTGHPLLVFTPPARAAGAAPPKPEPVVRTLELAVHLARSSSHVSMMRVSKCELSREGGDKCMSEVVRLVRRVGIGAQCRFLQEVDLSGNLLDAEAVRKIVEAGVKDRADRPQDAPKAPLWLDLSMNRVRNPRTVFDNLQAWAVWAHDKEGALCLADQEGCSKQACPKNCMVHLPGFLEQAKPEPPPKAVVVQPDPTESAARAQRRAAQAKTQSPRRSPRRRSPRPRSPRPRSPAPHLRRGGPSPFSPSAHGRDYATSSPPPRLRMRPAVSSSRGRSHRKRKRTKTRSRSRGRTRRSEIQQARAESRDPKESPPQVDRHNGSSEGSTKRGASLSQNDASSDASMRADSVASCVSSEFSRDVSSGRCARSGSVSPRGARTVPAAARAQVAPAASGANANDMLEQRINRLFETLKSSSGPAVSALAQAQRRRGGAQGSHQKPAEPERSRERRRRRRD